MKIRLQKFLANAGIASRRKAEDMILMGEITVNGTRPDKPGVLVDPQKDHIKVRGKLVLIKTPARVVYALFKPKSCVSTLIDPQGRRTVADFFPRTSARLFPVGRLDYDVEGLLLVTNDGELANSITHPKKHIWKEYFVKIKGKINTKELTKIRRGLVMDKKKLQPVRVKVIHLVNDKTWLAVSLQEGIKNQIKRMFLQSGYHVLKIKRYRVGNIELGDMKPGQTRLLTNNEIKELTRLTNIKS